MRNRLLIVLIFMTLSPAGFAQIAVSYVSDTQGVSLEELAKTALTLNKDLHAARESLSQAEARLEQARLRPNPSLDVSRTTDVMFGNDGDTGFGIALSQPLELGGKRSKRINVEEISIELAKAQIADAERQLGGKLRSLFTEAVAAAARLDLFDRLERTNQQMVSVMEVRLRSGDASKLDSQLVAAQTNQVRAQRAAAENDMDSAVLKIRSLAGLAPAETLVLRRQTPAEVTDSEEVLVSRALENRPDLKAAKLREELEEAGISLAKAQAVPNISAFVRYVREAVPILATGTQRRSFDQESVMEFGVSVPLPFFNREQGNIVGAVSRRSQARSEREALEVSIRQEVSLAYRRYQTARRTLEILRTGVIQPSQESVRIVQLAYNLGQLRLLDVVTQQRAAIEAETNYSEAQATLDMALADLDAAAGKMF